MLLASIQRFSSSFAKMKDLVVSLLHVPIAKVQVTGQIAIVALGLTRIVALWHKRSLAT